MGSASAARDAGEVPAVTMSDALLDEIRRRVGGHLGAVQLHELVAELEAWRLRLAAVQVTHGGLRYAALLGNLTLCYASCRQVGDQLLPVHRGPRLCIGMTIF